MFGRCIHVERLCKLVAVCEDLHEVWSIEKEDTLDVRMPRGRLESKVEANGIAVKSADEVSETVVVGAYAFAVGKPGRDNAALIRLDTYFLSGKVKAGLSVNLEEQLGIEVEVHARVFLHASFRLRDFEWQGSFLRFLDVSDKDVPDFCPDEPMGVGFWSHNRGQGH